MIEIARSQMLGPQPVIGFVGATAAAAPPSRRRQQQDQQKKRSGDRRARAPGAHRARQTNSVDMA